MTSMSHGVPKPYFQISAPPPTPPLFALFTHSGGSHPRAKSGPAIESDRNEQVNHWKSWQTTCFDLWKRSESLRNPFNVCRGRTV